MLLLTKIQSWLLQPKVCKFVCFVSSIVGLLCYALSSSFIDLFGKWNWWKILLYIVFSFIISLTVLLAKTWEGSPSLSQKAHTTFLALLIISVYSFFFDKQVKGKPDAYNLVSCAAFAIMSLGLSTLSHFGFEVDLLYFFSEVLIIQLMKIKLWLVIVGGCFSYSLVILRSTLNPRLGSELVECRDQSYTLINVESLENVVTEIVWFSRGSNPSVTVKAEFMRCIDVLKKENVSVIGTISKHVNEYLKTNVLDEDQISVPKLQHDTNLLMDVLPLEIVNDLHQSIKQMVLEGFKNECIQEYTNCRREFLKETLSTFGLQFLELNREDIDKTEKIENWIKASNVALRLLFPSEKELCDRVFRGSISSREFAFTEVCTELATSLLSTAKAMAIWGHFMPKTLLELVQDFQPMLLNEQGKSLRYNAQELIRLRLGIFGALENVSLVPSAGVHPNIYDAINNVTSLFQRLHHPITPPVYMARMIELLETSLEANSKIYNKPTLGYVFIMNNRRFIELQAKRHQLGPFFDDDWLQNNTKKFQQNLELYQSTWNKILDFLKLDFNESDPNVVEELMKHRLFWFNEHFDETCNVQSEWPVFGGQLRKEIIQSIEDMLLPAYGNFVWRFQEFFGKYAYEHIKYGIFDVQNRLNNLFLVREGKLKVYTRRT